MSPSDPAGFAIRAGRPDDIPAVHGAILKLAGFLDQTRYVSSTPDDLARNAFGENPAFSIAIAEADKNFAGMCLHFPIFSTWMGCRGVYVQDLFVEAAFRRHGLGEALLRHVARLSREKGGGYLRLAVDTDNLAAQAFYVRLGIKHAYYEQTHTMVGTAFRAFCEGGGS